MEGMVFSAGSGGEGIISPMPLDGGGKGAQETRPSFKEKVMGTSGEPKELACAKEPCS
ncbi:nuclear hormone receptor FTZ-F1 beta [Sesbania bispinosa]|nr:nuclear hormone receptor FTZ-F1 beta [Sesbania bispinosa]